MGIQMEVRGIRELRTALDNMASSADDVIERAVYRSAIRVQAATKRKLSDQVLKVRTGRLRRSINVEMRRVSEGIAAAIGTNVEYARVHEYGFRGQVYVGPHQRTQTKAWGRSITPRSVTVREHFMRINLPERSFLRLALREQTPAVQAELRQAITELLG